MVCYLSVHVAMCYVGFISSAGQFKLAIKFENPYKSRCVFVILSKGALHLLLSCSYFLSLTDKNNQMIC